MTLIQAVCCQSLLCCFASFSQPAFHLIDHFVTLAWQSFCIFCANVLLWLTSQPLTVVPIRSPFKSRHRMSLIELVVKQIPLFFTLQCCFLSKSVMCCPCSVILRNNNATVQDSGNTAFSFCSSELWTAEIDTNNIKKSLENILLKEESYFKI